LGKRSVPVTVTSVQELFWIKGDPLLKTLEADPRYKTFLRKR
jgi:hypothetical protein